MSLCVRRGSWKMPALIFSLFFVTVGLGCFYLVGLWTDDVFVLVFFVLSWTETGLILVESWKKQKREVRLVGKKVRGLGEAH